MFNQGRCKPPHNKTTTHMKQIKLTPAQDYAKRIVYALDRLMSEPENTELANEVLTTVLERPRTLRCALSAYLYKSQSVQLQRR